MTAKKKPAKSAVPDDVKQKFREALVKKHAHGGADVSDDGAQLKVDHAQGPARQQQMFRRKSGG